MQVVVNMPNDDRTHVTVVTDRERKEINVGKRGGHHVRGEFLDYIRHRDRYQYHIFLRLIDGQIIPYIDGVPEIPVVEIIFGTPMLRSDPYFF